MWKPWCRCLAGSWLGLCQTHCYSATMRMYTCPMCCPLGENAFKGCRGFH